MFRVCTSLILLSLWVVPAVAEEVPLQALRAMAQRYQGLTDYTANFLKQEIVDGKRLPRENIFLKFRKPFGVYMRWLKGPHKGREVLYAQGKYDGKLIGHEGGFFGFITLSLDPKGRRAMKGNRYPITEAGIGKIIDRVLTDVEQAHAQGTLRFTEVGTAELFGRKVRQITILLPESPNRGFSAPKMKLWIDTENGLPIQAEFFDWDGRKVEFYAYKDLKLNVGLTDSDFDRDKDMYDF